jgi:fumarate reductase flavoprotein subunit
MSAPEEVFDVVVIGGGGAGLAAAIEAASAGRKVVLLEKHHELHGSTAWSVGSITASATPHQRRMGIADGPEDHWLDMAFFNGELDARDNPALRRVLAEAMPDTFRWLLSHGIRFYGPMPEPPHRKPRMHSVLPNSRSFIVHLRRAALRAGVDIRLQHRAAALLTQEGRVIGVECETQRGRQHFRAHLGTVLATGDFTNDPELKQLHMGAAEANVEGVNTNATGDGQKLAIALGAKILNGDQALGPELRFVPPPRKNILLKLPPWRVLANLMAWSLDHMPSALLRPFVMSFVTTTLAPSPNLFTEGAILINSQGERFADELDKPAYAVPDQPGKTAYILLDARLSERFSAWPNYISTAPGVAYAYVDDYRRNRSDVFASAPTLDALAHKLRMPPGKITTTVGSYNAAARNRPPLGLGPYTALGPARAVFVHAEGGLAVDHEHRVLGEEGQPVPDLYAAGSVGQGGLLLKGHGHHLAWAFASGRRAGRHAANPAARSDKIS